MRNVPLQMHDTQLIIHLLNSTNLLFVGIAKEKIYAVSRIVYHINHGKELNYTTCSLIIILREVRLNIFEQKLKNEICFSVIVNSNFPLPEKLKFTLVKSVVTK